MKTTCARATEIDTLLLIAAGLCTNQVITTVAGGGGNGLGDNGPATSARLSHVFG